jgi:hypothetical protein
MIMDKDNIIINTNSKFYSLLVYTYSKILDLTITPILSCLP